MALARLTVAAASVWRRQQNYIRFAGGLSHPRAQQSPHAPWRAHREELDDGPCGPREGAADDSGLQDAINVGNKRSRSRLPIGGAFEAKFSRCAFGDIRWRRTFALRRSSRRFQWRARGFSNHPLITKV